ncbi:DNA-binding transcriptional regulator Crl [Vibrio sinaloensis DSM 21326]|uniref:Sigma factor-binding protein Crl n=1 Tax=Vibrio sinaloensis DSM 21326 TaxID=945550 RepID=E8M7M9_PHOS4|nr:sigma factor-binding protein Crl [Vibrio sinaloensis]EGA70009.1 DNA-binding transcriptional regulator Crl [Vibrio sinaloensis DSM 21326]
MSDTTKTPTHYRLLSVLRAIGPYLRESQSEEGAYLFDCLSVCVDDKKSPEQREFWGWWLELKQEGDAYQARYRIGLYDISGEWQDKKIPKKAVEDVNRTQEAFHLKLVETLQSEFGIPIQMHQESVEFV